MNPSFEPNPFEECTVPPCCSEQCSKEHTVTIKGKEICKWCFAKDPDGHDFTCNKEHRVFHTTAIPTECVNCGTQYIEHESSRVCSWIDEEQTRKNREEHHEAVVSHIS